ncbi:MAG: hypothetical protein ACM65L_02915 [Microcoleus sp.]
MRWPKFGFCVVRVNLRYLYPNQGEEGETPSSPWLGGTPHFATFIHHPADRGLGVGGFGGWSAPA